MRREMLSIEIPFPKNLLDDFAKGSEVELHIFNDPDFTPHLLNKVNSGTVSIAKIPRSKYRQGRIVFDIGIPALLLQKCHFVAVNRTDHASGETTLHFLFEEHLAQ